VLLQDQAGNEPGNENSLKNISTEENEFLHTVHLMIKETMAIRFYLGAIKEVTKE